MNTKDAQNKRRRTVGFLSQEEWTRVVLISILAYWGIISTSGAGLERYYRFFFMVPAALEIIFTFLEDKGKVSHINMSATVILCGFWIYFCEHLLPVIF